MIKGIRIIWILIKLFRWSFKSWIHSDYFKRTRALTLTVVLWDYFLGIINLAIHNLFGIIAGIILLMLGTIVWVNNWRHFMEIAFYEYDLRKKCDTQGEFK